METLFYNFLAAFIFGAIGWGAFKFGKSLERWKPQIIGVALMGYPYIFMFVELKPNIEGWLMWGIGVALIVLLCFQHDE